MRSIVNALSRAPVRAAFALAACLTLVANIPGKGAAAAELTFDLHVERGRLSGNVRTIQVKQDDAVKLRFTTDRKLILHLHGYDIEKGITPGVVGELTFTARATGRFPLHGHGPNERAGGHGHEEPPLAYVEVYPR